MVDPRSNVQKEAKEAYLESNKRSTLIVGTGGGKSFIAIEIIKALNPSNILLLTNSELLRDVNWKAEFEKFDCDWSKVQSETYQKMYKETGEWDMIIMDKILSM